ncbi:MAG: metal-dependent hydrolase [Burkholderiales bacterium]|nr:metal-dependent hydrolase [Burkholderiales bacterium]MBH2017599.1 metal-dependent hydrolase [Burkholderiales bacterium]
MTHPQQTPPPIVPREKLDFGLDGDIAKYWLDNDPFKTRFFDALSTLFPIGEKFFITCVRDFRDRITDPKMLQDIKDFTRQEGQHGILHTQYNNRLKAQGIAVDAILEGQEKRLFGIIRKHFSREFTLGITAASEHITAIMADCFVERPEIFAHADERIRALYVWHAMEEMEHKGVAYDVLVDVAQASYRTRIASMLLVTFLFPFHVFRIMSHMLQVDGFSRWQRTKIWAKGLWWLYKPGGIYLPMMGKYFSYLKPGFHPWQEPVVASYEPWLKLLKETGNPIEAGNRLTADALLARA